MNKNVKIIGKYSLIKLKKEKIKRNKCDNWNISEKDLDFINQLNLLNECYLNYDKSNSLHNYLLIEIKNKLSSYKNQDKSKHKFDNNNIISLENIFELLVLSKLKCYYCKERIYLLYEYVKDGRQWSLDRINNEYGHNKDNCVISCLQCNLKRRDIDKDKFKFTKQMKLIKLDN
jgi:hypothetical protein